MKHLIKDTTEPDHFSRWKKQNKKAGWNNFSGGSEYGEVKEQLIAEQLGMCCYCEVIISLNDCHIEHLKPKSIYPQNMFTYDNLLASCNRKESCGHKKGSWYSPAMISPLEQVSLLPNTDILP
jgi:5-methylcytosine-specific restriction endonuclease McrA